MSAKRTSISLENSIMDASVRSWAAKLLDRPFDSDRSFHETFKDGTLLCEIANKLRPGIIPVINKPGNYIKELENIAKFVRVIPLFGLRGTEFSALDLYEKKDIPKVLRTLLVLSQFSSEQIQRGEMSPRTSTEELDRPPSTDSENGVLRRTRTQPTRSSSDKSEDLALQLLVLRKELEATKAERDLEKAKRWALEEQILSGSGGEAQHYAALRQRHIDFVEKTQKELALVIALVEEVKDENRRAKLYIDKIERELQAKNPPK